MQIYYFDELELETMTIYKILAKLNELITKEAIEHKDNTFFNNNYMWLIGERIRNYIVDNYLFAGICLDDRSAQYKYLHNTIEVNQLTKLCGISINTAYSSHLSDNDIALCRRSEIESLNASVNEIKKGRNTNMIHETKVYNDEKEAYFYALLSEVNKNKIKKVIFNDPATIVFWEDSTKTVVKNGGEQAFDPEKGLSMAISKKFLGNEGNYYETFKKWLPKE